MPQTAQQPELIQRLERHRERYRDHGVLFRAVWVVAAVIVVVAGAAMIALPGPAFVVIPVGLVMLSFEFCWAQRLLDKGVAGGAEAAERVKRADPRVKALGIAAVVCAVLAAAVIAVLVL